MSPEMIRMQGHNKSTDHWSWAVVVFKLVTGRYPFKGTNESILYENICRSSFAIVGSYEFRSLMVAILYADPTKRLGSAVNGWRDIFAHSWFHNDESFNLQLLRKRELKAPWVPSSTPYEKEDQLVAQISPLSQNANYLTKNDDSSLRIDSTEQEVFKSFGPYIDKS